MSTRLAADPTIELLRPPPPGGPPKVALFDFDGTISLIRTGWQQVMLPLFVELLSEAPRAEGPDELAVAVRDFVDELTGKQTIYQCLRLADEIIARGGSPPEPLAIKHEYLRRLRQHMGGRLADLEAGRVSPPELRVSGSRELLEALRERGVSCVLASGTEEADVRAEARLLDVAEFFDGGIFGAQDEYQRFSKAMVIDRLVAEHHLGPGQLVGFGDGYVEIENTVAAGGLAVAAATDEVRRSGRADPWKRDRLTRAGAHVLVPDFACWPTLVPWLCGERSSGG